MTGSAAAPNRPGSILRGVIPTGAIRVLLVDDDRDNREMYEDYLRFTGMLVQTCHAAAEALALIQVERPDVVVTDLHLPGMSGLDLTRRLRENPTTASVPVILLTGDGLGNIEMQARAAGCAEMCLKPCLPDALAETVVRVVAARQA